MKSIRIFWWFMLQIRLSKNFKLKSFININHNDLIWKSIMSLSNILNNRLKGIVNFENCKAWILLRDNFAPNMKQGYFFTLFKNFPAFHIFQLFKTQSCATYKGKTAWSVAMNSDRARFRLIKCIHSEFFSYKNIDV